MAIINPYIKNIKKPHPPTPFRLYQTKHWSTIVMMFLIVIFACALSYPIKFIISFPQLLRWCTMICI